MVVLEVGIVNVCKFIS